MVSCVGSLRSSVPSVESRHPHHTSGDSSPSSVEEAFFAKDGNPAGVVPNRVEIASNRVMNATLCDDHRRVWDWDCAFRMVYNQHVPDYEILGSSDRIPLTRVSTKVLSKFARRIRIRVVKRVVFDPPTQYSLENSIQRVRSRGCIHQCGTR